jgi:hypothetical protein
VHVSQDKINLRGLELDKSCIKFEDQIIYHVA